MRRRSLVRVGLAAVSAAFALPALRARATEVPAPPAPVAAPAVVKSSRELRLVMSWPRATPGIAQAAERFADAINKLSDGRLRVTLFGAGELVPVAAVLEAVADGTADIGYGASYFWALRGPAFHVFTGMPFGFTAQEMIAWLEAGGGQALWEELYKPLDIQPFYGGSSGTQPGGWFRREIAVVGEFKGLRIRIAGLGAEVMKRLGAQPLMMPSAEIPALLKDGQLDAVEWIGPWADEAFGLPKLARYYYMPGLLEPGPSLEIIVNRKLYVDLPAEQRAAIAAAAAMAAAKTLGEFTYHNAITLPKLLKEGVEVRRFPPDVIKAMARATQEVVDGLAANDPLTRRILASYTAFWQASRSYAPFAEGGYLAERQAAFA